MLALNLSNLGLFTYNNTIADVPPGALAVASNIVIDRPKVAETRRGFKQFGNAVGDNINQYFAFQSRLLMSHGTSLAYDSTGAGVWTNYSGSFSPPSGIPKIHAIEANKNLYLTTDNGVYKIDTITNNPILAGGIPALDFTATTTGMSGFLDDSSQCGYAIVWGYFDSNGNEILGDPSMFTYVSNASGGSRNVALVITIPAGVTTDYFYQIYRTPQTDSLSVPPGDNLQLAYQKNPTSGEIAAKVISVTDITPDTLLGGYLYTSLAAEGPAATNDPPPLANDICTFQGMTFYANCTTIQSVYVTLLGTGSPNGFQNDDTITIQGTTNHTYTGKSSNDFSLQQFKVVTGGTIAANIDATARNLVAAINQDTTNTEFYAFYQATFTSDIGVILLKARNLNHAAFSVVSSRGGAFAPVLPSSGTSYISSNNQVLNGVYVSKLNQPEAVPISSLNFVGSGDQPIYRILALRDAVLVMSQGGLWRITGTSPSNLTFTPIDQTVFIDGLETAVKLNNSVYTYSTQGVVSITDSAQIMSRNIEGDLLTLSSDVYPSFADVSFAVSYESDRKYIFFTNSDPSDTNSTVQFVYNWITQAWTTWTLSATAAIVNPFDNKLYYATPDGITMQERKSFTVGDYADAEFAVNIESYSDDEVTLTDASDAVIGMTLGQDVTLGQGGISSIITAVNLLTNVVTVRDELTWTIGAAAVYSPIDVNITWQPISCGFPAYLKRFARQIQFIFSLANFNSIEARFNTDMYPSSELVSLVPVTVGGFGTKPWGTFNWGVTNASFQPIPTYLTRNTQVCHWLNVSLGLNQAFQNLSCDGFNLFYSFISEVGR